jgi:sugar/nucleoside kinase (ribokinase family)
VAEEAVEMRGVAIDADAATGVYFVTHGAQGHEFSYLRAGSAASRMRPETLPLDVVRSARLLHVSGISQAISASACDTVFAAIDEASAAGALRDLRSQLATQALATGARTRDDFGNDGSLRLVRAQPRRCIGAFGGGRCRRGGRLSSCRRARGGP